MIIECVGPAEFNLTPILPGEEIAEAFGFAKASEQLESYVEGHFRIGQTLNAEASRLAIIGACELNKAVASETGIEFPARLEDPRTEIAIRENFALLVKNLPYLMAVNN